MAVHALRASSELNLCFGVRAHTLAPWDLFSIEWSSLSLSLSFCVKVVQDVFCVNVGEQEGGRGG